MKKKILITGGSGLLALNWAMEVRDQYTILLGIHKRKVVLSGMDSQYCPLDSVNELAAFLDSTQPDIVIHTAGLTNVEECEENPELAQLVNVNLSENVATACAKLKITHVHISTDHLFSGDKKLITEEEPVAPLNMYARTKAEAEQRVLDSNPDALIIRTNFYGWGPSYRQSFSDYIITTLSKGHSATLYQDTFYTPILAGELARTVHDLIKHDVNGIFNVVGDERLSKYEFGLKIANHFQFDAKLINPGLLTEQSSMVRRPLDMSLSNKKTCQLLGRPIGGVDDHLQLLKQQQSKKISQEIAQL